MPMPTHFGGYLRLWREAKGLTSTDIAEATNLTPNEVEAIEMGYRKIPPLIITPWADRVGVLPQAFVVTMANVDMRKICLQARLPYIFKLVPLDDDEQIIPEPAANFAYPQKEHSLIGKL